MSSSTKKDASDKLHIVDRKTFESIQQHQSSDKNETFRKIRNAKFRKKSAAKGGSGSVFSLMQFLTKTPKQKQKENKDKRYTACLLGHRVNKSFKKHGKTREAGKRKKLSKLKKSILRYRQQKKQELCRIAEDSDELLKEAVEGISNLSLSLKYEEKEQVPDETKKTIHSRRFRSYCDNCTTPLLSELTEQLLRELDRFQKRALVQNAIKAHAHRRFVVGFRESQSFLLVKKVKLFIIAPDCEVSDGEDGLDAKISNIKIQCQQQNIPYIFSLRRRQLAYALFKKAPIGCVAVLDIDGAREIFARLMEALQEAKKSYGDLTINRRTEKRVKDNNDK